MTFDEMSFENEDDSIDDTEKLIYLDSEGAHISARSVAEKLEKKKLSASMITGLLGDTGCAARWLADSFVVREVVEEEPDSPARRGSLFHKVMEDLFALEPEERTQTKVKELAVQTLKSDEFKDLSKNRDVFEWLKGAINGYYSMGGNPEKVEIAEISMEEGKDPKKGLEIFVKGRIGDSKREILGFIDRLVLNTVRKDGSLIIEDWKGLALDTLLPTPNGWTTMKEVQEGDQVLGSQGQIINVLNKSDIHNRPCYEITFSNGETVVCDNVHLWTFDHYLNTTQPGQTISERNITLDADEVYEEWKKIKDHEKSHLRIKNTSSLKGIKAFQKLEEIDDFVNVLIQEANGEKSLSSSTSETVQSLLRSTDEERLFFLRSLMRYYGVFENYSLMSGIVVFEDSTPDFIIREIFKELLSTFGMNYTQEDDGSISFLSVLFNPFHEDDENSFSKLEHSEIDYSIKSFDLTHYTYIVDMKPVESVPTQCIKVDSDDSLYLFGSTMIPTHNTGAKAKKWKSHTKSDEGLAEQRQQLIYKMLLEQQGFKVSGARLIYPVAGEIVKVDMKDEELAQRVVQDVEETDKALDVMIENNTFEYKPSFLCSWCSLSKICIKADIKPYKKMQDAYASQPEPEVLLKVIDVR